MSDQLLPRRSALRVALFIGFAGALVTGSAPRSAGAQAPARAIAAALTDGDSSLSVDLQHACAAVWVAWARNDQALLRELVPPDILVVAAGNTQLTDRAQFLAAARNFSQHHGHLIYLELADPDAQPQGNFAVLYARYTATYEYDGQRNTAEGRATVTFARRGGKWQSVAWHLDSAH
jgi:ketosteroid isomerase-like protein